MIRLSIVGDVLLDRAIPAALARDRATLRQTAHTLWRHSDYVLGNLECPLTTHQQPATKRYVFRADPRYAAYLRSLGFTHLSLANNHTLDQHAPGLHDTGRHLRAAGLGAVGYEVDSLAGCLPTLLDSTLAVFGYSALHQRVPEEGCVCGRDFAKLCERVAAYKTLFPRRAVVVYLHWGVEYAERPTATQRAQARQLIDCGAAAVVGAHPHVVQSVETYRGRPILYSLGNFLFDQRGRQTDLALQADFDVRGGRVVATYLRPLQLISGVPCAAEGAAARAVFERLKRLSPTITLRPSGAHGWQLEAPPPPPADSLTGFFPRQIILRDATESATFRVAHLPTSGHYRLSLTTNGRTTPWRFGYPIYRLTQGDVDNDGHPDVLIGPVKATRFDSMVRRRLFVYRVLPNGRLQPRWLGSKVAYPLCDFRAVRTSRGTFVRTLEREPNGTYAVGWYYWQGFGLVLDHFPARSLPAEAAYRRFVTDGGAVPQP